MKWLIVDENKIINLSLVQALWLDVDPILEAMEEIKNKTEGKTIYFILSNPDEKIPHEFIRFESKEKAEIAFNEIKIFLNSASPVLYIKTKEKEFKIESEITNVLCKEELEQMMIDEKNDNCKEENK